MADNFEVFRNAFEAGDIDAAVATFAVDAELRSPFSDSAYVGVGPIRLLLAHVRDSLERFRYVDVIDGKHRLKVLLFEAEVGGERIEGADLLRVDDGGLISELTVMVRPKSAAKALERAMRARVTGAGRRGAVTNDFSAGAAADVDACSTANESLRRTVETSAGAIAYVDIGSGDPVVFLHGNPTSSHLWRNVIPRVAEHGRCLAPDLMGMGFSDRPPDRSYRFVDHRDVLDEWFRELGLDRNVTLVVHDWGSALGFDWAARHPDAVRAIVYMEAIVRPMAWEEWPELAREIFQQLRSDAGEQLILEHNLFVETLLPLSSLRGIPDAEMAVYRAPYVEAGEARRPTLQWPREVPIEGEPADVTQIVTDYGEWLEKAQVPKLFINAEPGMILTGAPREYCRSWPNQTEVTIAGSHYIQEDAPEEVGRAIAEFVRRP